MNGCQGIQGLFSRLEDVEGGMEIVFPKRKINESNEINICDLNIQIYTAQLKFATQMTS